MRCASTASITPPGHGAYRLSSNDVRSSMSGTSARSASSGSVIVSMLIRSSCSTSTGRRNNAGKGLLSLATAVRRPAARVRSISASSMTGVKWRLVRTPLACGGTPVRIDT